MEKRAAKDGTKTLVIALIKRCDHHLGFFKCACAKRITCTKQKSEIPFRYLLDAIWSSLLFMGE